MPSRRQARHTFRLTCKRRQMGHGMSRNEGKIERGRSEVCVREWMLRHVMAVGERVASVL